MRNNKKYSTQEIQNAKNIDIIEFLSRYYAYSFKEKGREFRCVEHNSLVVKSDRKTWYWNSKQIGGSGCIDFLMKIENKTFIDSMKTLLGEPMLPVVSSPTKTQSKRTEIADVSLPKKADGKYSRAFAYLNKTRGISACIIQDLMKNEKIFQDAKGNVVFVNYNTDNKPSFWTSRGTLSGVQYRGNAPLKSDDNVEYVFENYGFSVEGTEKHTVYVFEAPIDLLSHASIANENTGKLFSWKVHSRVALCGVSDVALEQYLEKHPDVKNIVFCLDNDNAGRNATQKLISKYSEKNYNCLDNPPKLKDVNEDLLALIAKKKEMNFQRRNER